MAKDDQGLEGGLLYTCTQFGSAVGISAAATEGAYVHELFYGYDAPHGLINMFTGSE
ncbi:MULTISPECIES: hypothetical protein [Streptomyces]|uniref:hypothetical protein n=1 Tax=Streptomyces TaxID=1883 RepID=UPI00340411C5